MIELDLITIGYLIGAAALGGIVSWFARIATKRPWQYIITRKKKLPS
jgi:hypothetical protein